MRSFSAVLAMCLYVTAAVAAPAKAVKSAAAPELMYLGVWPHTILIVDANQEKVIDKIDLPTDIARTMLLSPDKKKLIVSTLRDNSILTIDLATKKIEGQFSLNDGPNSLRLGGLTADPTGKHLYGVGTAIEKKIDHYEIDLDAKKVVRSQEFGKEDALTSQRSSMKVSPDGKLLYMFRQSIFVYDTSTLKMVKKIELSKAEAPETATLSLSPIEDPNAVPGKVTGIFNSSDPYVHQRVFGIAEIDLNTQSYELTPIGPSETSIQPLLMSPDRKYGYTVAIYGTHGNRVTEFWVFDMKTRKLLNKREFIGRTRLNFGLTADGTKLLIYNAGFEIEVYDAKTLAMRSTIDLHGDTTSNLVVMPIAGR
jgi:DNA-binding beta-propeller fold protein YncE